MSMVVHGLVPMHASGSYISRLIFSYKSWCGAVAAVLCRKNYCYYGVLATACTNMRWRKHKRMIFSLLGVSTVSRIGQYKSVYWYTGVRIWAVQEGLFLVDGLLKFASEQLHVGRRPIRRL
jgi:hypothetical protein